MSSCQRCGAENPAAARFCSVCGTRLEPVEAEVRRTVTVLFSDVTNSTRLGEQLDPESHRRVMSRIFDAMRGALERHGGTVEKFIGDAVMAVFGLPVLHEDDALRAVRAADEMRGAVAGVNVELRRHPGVEISLRTGINTGEVVAGDSATTHTLVTGDAVVVAKRLEETAAPGEIQLGEDTFRLVRDSVQAEPVGGGVEAKGKPGLLAWRLLGVEPRAEVIPLRLDSPLVGRELDLAALQETYERAVAERACRVFTVLGTAGIGKSRLMYELVSWIGDRALVLRGRCLPYGEGITFWPLVEIVRQAAGLADDDTPEVARSRIGALLSPSGDSELICARVAAAVGRGAAGGARPEETFWAVRRLFESIGAERPVVVVFDDIQWAESTFLDLIDYVGARSLGAAVLICCLARPELLETRPSWALPRANATALLLDPLREAEAGELIANLLGRLPVSESVRRRIAAAAEGNPLFVEELVRMLVDEGLLRRTEDGWTAAQGGLDRLAVPPSIHALLAARLDRLEPEERKVIQRASVAGQVFWWGAVAELTPEAEREAVGSRLQALARKDLIRHELSTFAAEDAFRFGHILVRDAAYAALPKEERAVLHERLSGWLEGKSAGRVAEYEEMIGYHLEQAFLYRSELSSADESARRLGRRAAERFGAAGRRAHALGDAPTAVRLFDRAAALLPHDDLELMELGTDLVPALREAGQLGRAEALLHRALEAADRWGQAALGARAQVALGTIMLQTERVDADAVIADAERAIAVLEEAGDDLGLARAWTLIGQAHWLRCRCAAMEEVLERALEHAERAGAAREQASILNGLARAALAGPLPVDEAIVRCEAILERARGDRTLDAEVSAILAGLHAMRGEIDQARELYERSRTLLSDLGRRWSLAAVGQYSGYVELLAGDAEAAVRELRFGYDSLVRMGDRAALSTVAGGLAIVLQALRRNDEAWEFSLIGERAASPDDIVSQVLWRSARGKLLLRRGSAVLAEALAHEAVTLAEGTDLLDLQGAAHLDLALVHRVSGDERAARTEAETALERITRKGNLVSARRVRRFVGSLEGLPGLTPAARSDT